MKRILTLIALITGLALAGCGGSTTTKVAQKPTATTTTATTSSAPYTDPNTGCVYWGDGSVTGCNTDAASTNDGSIGADSATTQQQDLTIGDTTTLTGNDGVTVDVAAMKVHDPARVGDLERGLLKPGERFVTIDLTITDSGDSEYHDSPVNSSTLIDSDGEHYTPSFVLGTSELRLNPADVGRAHVTFVLPRNAKAASYQFAMNSGMGDESAEWGL